MTRLSVDRRPYSQQAIRAGAASAYLGGGNALCRVLGRYKLYVDTRDVGLSSHLLLDGFWEMWTTEALVERVKPGMVVADVGANLGYFSVLMADLVGPQGAVHAIEPNPKMVDLLRRSLQVNGYQDRVHVHPVPLSDRDGDLVRLQIPPTDPMNTVVVPCPIETIGAAVDANRAFTSRMDSLPDLAAVDVIKIDAEGAEEAIWAGMAGILTASRPLTIILEFTPARYRDPLAFLGAITQSGFSLVLIDRARGQRPTSAAEIMSVAPLTEDRMLLLCR